MYIYNIQKRRSTLHREYSVRTTHSHRMAPAHGLPQVALPLPARLDPEQVRGPASRWGEGKRREEAWAARGRA